MSAAMGMCRLRLEIAPHVERQQEKHERHQIADDAGQEEQHAGQYLAPAVEEAAERELFSVHRGRSVRAKGDAFAAQQNESRHR